MPYTGGYRRLVLLFLILQTISHAQTASVSGSVESMNGTPLSGAQVRLVPEVADSDQKDLASSTNSSGQFTIAGIRPGAYRITAVAVGHMRGAFGSDRAGFSGTPVQLRVGEARSDLKIKLFRQGVIEGKVVNSDGNPIAADVRALTTIYINGKRRFFPSSSAQTNAAGEFTLKSLQPGTYVLAADPKSRPTLTGDKPTGKEPRRTYYPNSLAPENAVRIVIAPGSDIRGIGIKLSESEVFTISGKVQWAIENTLVSSLILGLLPCGEDFLAVSSHPMTKVQPDQTFEFQGVHPGTYCLGPERVQGNPKSQSVGGQTIVTVTDADVQEVNVQIFGLSQLTGNIRSLEQPAEPVQAAEMGISILSLTGISLNLPRATVVDGAFVMKNIPPDKYAIRFSSLPDLSYVARVTFNGQDITTQGLDLSNGDSGEVEVILSWEAGQITGAVTQKPDGDGREAPVAQARVSVFSGANQPVFHAVTDSFGNFTVRNLPPGDYRVVAWEEINPSLAGVIQFCQQFEQDAEKVVLEKKSQKSVRLHPIPGDRILSAEATLR